MHIRTVLIFAFLVATLVPSSIFGVVSYNHSVVREFDEVKNRHLLLAQNLGRALDRYYMDVVATFDSMSLALLRRQTLPNLHALMASINMDCVLIVDPKTGDIFSRTDAKHFSNAKQVSREVLETAKASLRPGETTLTNVVTRDNGENAIMVVRQYGDRLAIAFVGTDYFVELGKSISFGVNGHAAIVDSVGNVLAHPRADWVKEHKNLSKVSAVARLMKGETGIEQFYSPALPGDMIAGLATIKGAGWGVMVPQPISELYDKAYESSKILILVLILGVGISGLIVAFLVNLLTVPIETFLSVIKSNSRKSTLRKFRWTSTRFILSEYMEIVSNYNEMVARVLASNERVRSMAYEDSLTGLPNREKLREMSEKVLGENRSQSSSGALIYVDLDDFKQVNDVYGHGMGDQYLVECTTRLKSAVEKQAADTNRFRGPMPAPVISRIGGDEFAILFPGLATPSEAQRFLILLQNELTAPSDSSEINVKRGASIGCARYPHDAETLDELVKLADIAMYHAKKSGKNRGELYRADIGTMTSSELRAQVELAIVNDELVLEYQPKVRGRDGVVTGVEALVRWNHPTFGRMAPDRWIPAIMKSPVISQLGEWVIAKAMDDHKTWKAAGLDLTVAVNVGSHHFSTPSFVAQLKEIAEQKDFNPNNMQVEITEDCLFLSEVDTIRTIEEMKALGFKIALDDFGTGYSNFARLCKLPVDCLKIDRSVVSNAGHDKRVNSMMQCIIMMADKLGCETVAEGVETVEDEKRAIKSGIHTLQGFLYSKSLQLDFLIDWVKTREAEHGKIASEKVAS